MGVDHDNGAGSYEHEYVKETGIVEEIKGERQLIPFAQTQKEDEMNSIVL